MCSFVRQCWLTLKSCRDSETAVLHCRPRVLQNGAQHLQCMEDKGLVFLCVEFRMSCELGIRPASACALYGMDAARLAYLALKDAEKITEIFPHQSEGYLRCAFAHYLSEHYQKALDACLEGIRWNFSSRPLKV